MSCWPSGDRPESMTTTGIWASTALRTVGTMASDSRPGFPHIIGEGSSVVTGIDAVKQPLGDLVWTHRSQTCRMRKRRRRAKNANTRSYLSWPGTQADLITPGMSQLNLIHF